MKVYLLRDPIALLIVSVTFSILSFILLLTTFILRSVLPREICLFLAFNILYSTGILIAFYWAAFHSDKTRISTKKYRKAMQVYEKNRELIAFLKKNDNKYLDIKPETAIDVAIQIMSQKGDTTN